MCTQFNRKQTKAKKIKKKKTYCRLLTIWNALSPNTLPEANSLANYFYTL